MISEDISLDLYLYSLKINRSHLIVLRYFVEETQHFLPKHKMLRELESYGYIWENEITPKGLLLWSEVISWTGKFEHKEQQPKKKKEYSKEFLEFWAEFPSTNSFDGFPGVRKLKVNQEKCAAEYDRLLKYIRHEDMIKALKYHVELTKELSRKEGRNKMDYFVNSLRYLKEKYFEPFIGQVKQEKKTQIINTNEIF